MASNTPVPTPDPPAPAAKKKRRRLIPALMAFTVLVAAAGAGYYFWFLRAAPAQAKQAEPSEPSGIVPLEPFVVNLADAAGSHFLRVQLSLVVSGEERATELEENAVERAHLRSAILEVLAQQQADRLVTPEGKAELKATIAKQAAHTIHGLTVTDVLLGEFVVQF